ncbi:hypothetical protein COC52_27000 [Priestia megaterium]|uniref:hypothetical protein n=1 Tax=Priestia megaterium TaxID=1404 RepID=UPI000BFB220B|nr:hypothetical protein [Priestia megaterium]PGQ86043.1 hypothetical protein COA18_10855 [Priestia megaterium]PGR21044.1 hypothetical protein COC52_27000 [Priestia megaterium]
MESNSGEANSTSPVELGEKEKKSFATSMMDASITVLTFTGLTYLLAMTFKRGYLGYYEVTSSLMLSDVGMNYIVNSFTYILVLLMFSGFIYFIFFPGLVYFKKESKAIYFVYVLLLLYLCLCWVLIWVFDIKVDQVFASILCLICAVILLLDVAVTSVKKYANKKNPPRLRSLINSIESVKEKLKVELNPFIFEIKKSIYLRFFILITCTIFAIFIFLNLGETVAKKKEVYLVIANNDSHFVVIAENSDYLLIAPVELDKKVITPHYSIIEGKSQLNKLVKLEAMKFNGGLKVKRVKNK